MKALFISNDPTIFNNASPARSRMRAYAAAIGELHILSSARPGAKMGQEGNLFVHPVFAWKIFRVRALAHRARALITAHGIEVVSAQDPFEHGLAALRAVHGTKAKLHVQVHTDFLSPWFVKSGTWRMSFLNQYRLGMARRVLPVADGIRVVSERIKTSIIAAYGSRVCEPSVIPVPVSMEAPLPSPLPSRAFSFSLIAVGRLEPEKRLNDVLAALKLVVTRYPKTGLFIVGSGSERHRLEWMAGAYGLADKVVFLDNRPDARALVGSAQAFVQASAYEGYGRTLIEAALARVPIITTDVGIVGDVLKDREDVYVTPVADSKALARGITNLIEDNVLRSRLALYAEIAARTHIASAGDISARIAADLVHTLV